jgi:hypothetical protein
VFGGAVLIIAGIAGFIEAHSNAPKYGECRGQLQVVGHKEVCFKTGANGEVGETVEVGVLLPGHLSQTPYDLLRIGAWALVIVGALVIVTGLIGYRAAQTRR